MLLVGIPFHRFIPPSHPGRSAVQRSITSKAWREICGPNCCAMGRRWAGGCWWPTATRSTRRGGGVGWWVRWGVGCGVGGGVVGWGGVGWGRVCRSLDPMYKVTPPLTVRRKGPISLPGHEVTAALANHACCAAIGNYASIATARDSARLSSSHDTRWKPPLHVFPTVQSSRGKGTFLANCSELWLTERKCMS